MKAPYESVNIEPFNYAISLIDGKWKIQILFWRWKYETMRYSELKKSLGNVTYKMLSNKLKELEQNCLIKLNMLFQKRIELDASYAIYLPMRT